MYEYKRVHVKASDGVIFKTMYNVAQNPDCVSPVAKPDILISAIPVEKASGLKQKNGLIEDNDQPEVENRVTRG